MNQTDLSGIIELLPENVANQIAAGEVVQRPASVVKELLENSIDAGASQLHLIVEDAGKTLIQLVDNGIGMNGRDLQLAFERHATSKIKKTEDLFALTTMGFRGEALASIAAVSQVEAIAKRASDEMGWKIRVEGGKRLGTEICQAQNGLNIAVRNLFYNIPARRNFLKSDAIEYRHICDEFQRIALAHPSLQFKMTHNGSLIYLLPESNFRKRVVGIMGHAFDQRLVPAEEVTSMLKISGFVGKPEFAKKQRGEQFLFVNNRYVKSLHIHQAILVAYDGLLADGKQPAYFLKLEINPKHIDINIHPTKTEIKFDDDKSVFTLVRVAVKHALGQFSVSPSLDFDREPGMDVMPDPNKPLRIPTIQINPNYNPFNQNQGPNPLAKKAQNFQNQPSSSVNWLQFEKSTESQEDSNSLQWVKQISSHLLLSYINQSLTWIHFPRAHREILYRKSIRNEQRGAAVSQQLIFPLKLEFDLSKQLLLQQIAPDLRSLGFDIEFAENYGPRLLGLPFGLNENIVLEALEETLGLSEMELKPERSRIVELWSKSSARKQSIKAGKWLKNEEINSLMEDLNDFGHPEYTFDGKKIWVQTAPDEMLKKEF